VDTNETVDSLAKLRGILDRFRSIGQLPNAATVLAELARPFHDEVPDQSACLLSLEIFWTMRESYQSVSAAVRLISSHPT
jgi:hypothetical protein